MKSNKFFPDFTKSKTEVEPAAWKQVLFGVMIALSVVITLVVLMNPVVYHNVLSLLK